MPSQLPELTMNIQDGSLGISPPSAALVQVKMGVCSGGTPNTLYSYSDPATMSATLGYGPGVEAAAVALTKGNPILVMPVNPSAQGFAGTVVKTGTGAGTLALSFAPAQTVLITITTAGAVGVMALTYKVGNGATSQAQLSSDTGGGSYTWRVPGTFTTITMAAGTYVLNSTYSISTLGVITVGGGGIATVTQVSSALDNYDLKVKIAVGGALGVMGFQYSLDAGNAADDTAYTFSPILISTGGGTYAIPNTGIVLTFASTFVVNDYYIAPITSAGYTTTDVTNAFTSLLGTYVATNWGAIHVVGLAASAAAAATLAATVDTQMALAESMFKYGRAIVECPTTGSIITSGGACIRDSADTDTAVGTAFASFTSTRVVVVPGDCDQVSPLTGRRPRRSGAWAPAARLMYVNPGRDISEVGLGALTGVLKLYRNETATPGLDTQRFTTLRTVQGNAGYYLTNAKTMALATSDYARLANARVMDLACNTVRQKLVPYINASLRVSKSTGKIVEKDALSIEAQVNAGLNAVLITPSPTNASAAVCIIDRSANILSTSTLPVTVRITPLGYTTYIVVNIGFTNPAIAQA